MKYRVEVEANTAIETLTVNGKEYVRKAKRTPIGVQFDGEFIDKVAEDPYVPEDILDKIYDLLDCDFFVTDVMDLCAEDTE